MPKAKKKKDLIKTSFELWAKTSHFSRTIAKGLNTTTRIWNLHDDAHDFDSHTSDLKEISRKFLVLISVNSPLFFFG
jgi:photosystem I P700 chlorophyll a apoprotein A1